MKRRLALAVLAAAASGAWAHQPRGARSPAELMDALMWGRETPGGPFALVDQHGRPRADKDFRGSFLLVSFGFTSCTDACPAELHEVGQLLERLGRESARVRPLFVTLDPERDTPARLSTYLQAFHPAIVGLTGSPQAIRKVADSYLVSYRKVPAPGGGYGIDHASVLYLMGADGRYRGFFPPGTGASRMLDVLGPLLRTS